MNRLSGAGAIVRMIDITTQPLHETAAPVSEWVS